MKVGVVRVDSLWHAIDIQYTPSTIRRKPDRKLKLQASSVRACRRLDHRQTVFTQRTTHLNQNIVQIHVTGTFINPCSNVIRSFMGQVLPFIMLRFYFIKITLYISRIPSIIS